ncbi:hypothetical protein GNF80_11930 [Clostridium perfringens]|nr:hypothetical protein [Clostridium perfringens]
MKKSRYNIEILGKYNYLSESEWNNTLLFIKKNLNSLKDLNFVLFGGEPLLNKSILLKIISDLHALRSKDLNVHISLITNGV